VSEKMFKIGEYLAKLQATAWLSHALCAPGQKDEESARDNHVLVCSFAKYSPILIFVMHILSNKRFLIWLLTTLTTP